MDWVFEVGLIAVSLDFRIIGPTIGLTVGLCEENKSFSIKSILVGHGPRAWIKAQLFGIQHLYTSIQLT